jgi:TRAP-type C4-dicarboxylate transport system permease small subunit
MSNIVKSIEDKVEKLLHLIIIITSFTITALMVFLVLSRYVFGWSVVGIHEVALVCAMWLYMTGSIIATKRSEHLVVDFFAQKITSEKGRIIHQRVIAAILIFTGGFFAYWSWKMLGWSLKRPQTTPALSIPLLIPQSAIIVACIGSNIYALRDFIFPGHRCHNRNEEEDVK